MAGKRSLREVSIPGGGVPVDDETIFFAALVCQPTAHLKKLVDQDPMRLWYILLKLP